VEDPPLPGLLVALALLLVSSYLSAATAALVKARRQTLEDLAEEGNRRARHALALAEDSSRLLNTIRAADAIMHFLIAGLVGIIVVPRLAALFPQPTLALVIGYPLVMLLAALVTLIVGDMLPDSLIRKDATRWAVALVGPLRLIYPFFAAAGRIPEWISERLSVSLNGNNGPELPLVTDEEIMTLVDAGEEEGTIQQDEKEMIYSVLHLDETLAREVMVPRVDVVAIETGMPLAEARDIASDSGHSRLPVYEGSLDHVVGLLYAKDLLEVWRNGPEDAPLESILRPALFVPETKRVSDLLRELRLARVHMAIVVDEYGGTSGLVTIEDIIEEIVGEIIDEYDTEEEEPYQKIGKDLYIFDGRIDLDDFNRLLDIELSDELGDTLAGYIYGHLGRLPAQGETLIAPPYRLEVLSIDDRRIRKVRVSRLTETETSSSHDHNDPS
jgi:putative hemolysin